MNILEALRCRIDTLYRDSGKAPDWLPVTPIEMRMLRQEAAKTALYEGSRGYAEMHYMGVRLVARELTEEPPGGWPRHWPF